MNKLKTKLKGSKKMREDQRKRNVSLCELKIFVSYQANTYTADQRQDLQQYSILELINLNPDASKVFKVIESEGSGE